MPKRTLTQITKKKSTTSKALFKKALATKQTPSKKTKAKTINSLKALESNLQNKSLFKKPINLHSRLSTLKQPTKTSVLSKTQQPIHTHKSHCQQVTIIACNRFMQTLKDTLVSYTNLVESITPGSKLPQQSAWYLRQGQLETLEPVLASLEASVQSPRIQNDDVKVWKQTLPNLRSMIGAASQVIPHIYQTQALHILLHLGEHPNLPDGLVAPLVEALHGITHQHKQEHLEQRSVNRAQRILKGLTPTPFASSKQKTL